jgi:hypothetical protein
MSLAKATRKTQPQNFLRISNKILGKWRYFILGLNISSQSPAASGTLQVLKATYLFSKTKNRRAGKTNPCGRSKTFFILTLYVKYSLSSQENQLNPDYLTQFVSIDIIEKTKYFVYNGLEFHNIRIDIL